MDISTDSVVERRAGNFAATALPLPGPLLVRARRFEDDRGFFQEVWVEEAFVALGIADRFVQDNHSLSRPVGTVRGLHYQLPPRPQAKLVRVLQGAILDVAVDIRRGSATFGQHVAVELSADEPTQLFVPAGFAHGFCTLHPDTEVAYKTSAPYDAALDRAIAWDDAELGIPWPVAADAAQLSDKDRRAPRLRDAELPPA